MLWHSIWHSTWHVFWRFFWHPIWHPFWNSIWHLFRPSFWHFLWRLADIRQCPLRDLELAVEVRQRLVRWSSRLRSGSVHWASWSSQLRSATLHWDLELSVEVHLPVVQQCPLSSGAHSWASAVPTEIWRSQTEWRKRRRTRRRKQLWEKSKETLTWQVRKNENASNNFTKYQITAALHPSISSLPTFLHSYIPQPTSC